jgi:phosphohistidine phosphatase SixA
MVDMLQTEFLNGCESLVLVGHEPLLGDLLGVLTSGNDRFSLQMGKGMLAAVRITEPQVMIGRLMTMVSQSAALRLG